MPYDENLADRVRDAIGFRTGLVEKKMFGGLGFMVDGNLCCCVAGDDLMLRVGASEYQDALSYAHVREMDKTGRPMKGWVLVSPEGVASDQDLEEWLLRGLKFVDTLPPK